MATTTGPNGNVHYVEPNFVYDFTEDVSSDGNKHEQAPDLSDYCIALDMEVEISGRNSEISQEGSAKRTIILSWKQDRNGSTVGFLEGTKIYKDINKRPSLDDLKNNTNLGKIHEDYVNSLTTNYTDIFYTDLKDYGTTEMFGIESVDVQYNNYMVPEITIKFVDIRGVSLFSPTEMRYETGVEGIKGMSKNDIASSFFQCFFTFPYPRFSIMIKGFYGNPVCYEVTCADFRASFVAETGNFEATAKFVGYSFSFLNDVSLNALLAAPFAKPIGAAYWEERAKDGGSFVIKNNKGGSTPMPTLVDIVANIASVMDKANKIAADDPAVKEMQAANKNKDDIKELQDIYGSWFDSVKAPHVNQPNENLRYKEISKKGSDYGFIIAVPKDITKPIELYNNSQIGSLNDSYNAIKKWSDDHKDYSITLPAKITELACVPIFQVTNGSAILAPSFKNEQIVTDAAKDWLKEFNIPDKRTETKAFITKFSRNDGYIYGFVSKKDTSFWNRELDRLENTSDNLKDEVKAAQDQAVTEALGFSPSLENITRIIFAHFETLMHMLFQTSVDIQKQHRTPDSLGVSNADLSDVSPMEKEVPPFPRVVISTTTSQGVTKKEDAWVGSFKGSTKFLEEDLVNSLFDAIDNIATKFKQADDDANNSGGTENLNTEEEGRAVMEIPLTPFDLFIPKNPYGSDKKVSLSLSSFAANVCSRMMAVMDLNGFSRGNYISTTHPTDAANTLGEAEAINFATLFPTIYPKIIKCLTGGEDNKALTPEVLLNIVTNKNDEATKAYKEGVHWPWDAKSDKDTALFTENNGVLYYDKFKSGNFTAYPVVMSVEEMASAENDSYDNGAAYNYPGGNSSQKNDIYAYHIFKNWKVVKSIIDTQVKGHTSDVDGLSNYMTTFNGFYYKPKGTYGYENLLHFGEMVGDVPCVLKPKITTVFHPGKIGEKGQVAGSRYMPSTKEKFKKVKGIFNGHIDAFNPANIGTVSRIGSYERGECKESNFTELLGSAEEGPQTGNYVFTEFLGFDQNGNLTGSKSLFGQEAYYNLPSESMKAFMFLQSISTSIYLGNCIQYNQNNSVTVVPRLFVLLVGGVIAAMRNPSNFDSKFYNGRIISKLQDFVTTKLSPMAKNQYYNEFNSFVNGSWKNIQAAYELGRKENVKRFLEKDLQGISDINSSTIDEKFYTLKDNFFENYMSVGIKRGGTALRLANRENSKIMTSLVAEMLTPTVCAMGTKFGKSLANGFEPRVSLNKSTATTYLKSFLKKLSELLAGDGNQGDGSDGDQGVSIANDPQATTEDMKVGLYSYLKILYDKWVPSTSEKEWHMEEFFKIDNGDRGHTIHFIDSYYNVIGQDIYINIGDLVNSIRNNFQYNNNVWSSMLMFMSDIYASAQCLFLSIQNFIDLNDINNMKAMFNLVPYNNITNVKRHPDFVVMYPYQPSENLDNGSSFENDGFMLNRSDEMANLPEALTSRSDNTGVQGFYLPAFGVAYGKQYQSMFSNIDVGMESPMVTEQSLKAKMVIAMQGAGEDKSGNSKGVVTAGQDLYSIYASNSYTCTVTMMGCAWVQPLMYFVLLNIPMFRGSYLIEKVSHHLEPGNMTTTFVGVRMANVSTRALKNPLYVTDSNNNGSYSDDLEAMQFKAADLDNDCPFETFSPYGGDGLGPSFASVLGKPISNAPDVGPVTAREMNRSGFTTVLDALTFGCLHEMYIYRDELAIALEATVIYNWVASSGNWKQLFSDKHKNEFVIAGCANGIYPANLDSIPKPDSTEYKKYKKVVQDVFTNSPSCILNKYGKATPNGSPITLDTLQKIYQTELTKASESKSGFHGDVILTYTNKNYSEIVKFRNTKGACWKAKPNNGSEKKDKSADFVKGLTEAIQNTMNSNDHLKVDLNFHINGMNFIITQKDGKTNKLAKVFDVLVRGYFDQYIQAISWRGADKDNPSSIGVTASEKPRNDKVRQEIYKADNSGNRYNCQPDGTIWGTNAYKTFIKKFGRDEVLKGGGIFAKTVPQCARANGNTVLQDKTYISGITVTSCADLVTVGGTSGVGGKLQASMPIGDGKFDAGKAANFLIRHALKESGSICAYAVQQAIRAGGVIAQNGSGYQCALNQQKSGFKILISGTTDDPKLSNYLKHPNVGDIMGMTKGSTNDVGHICMYCGDGNGWISDFKQGDTAYVYRKYGPGKYVVLQYSNGGKSSGGKIQGLCHNGVCLKS